MEAKNKILKEGATPTNLFINPDDYKNSFLKKTIFGMDIIVDKDVEKGKIYLIDTNKWEIVPPKIKKKTLYQKIMERIKGIIRIIKYGDRE